VTARLDRLAASHAEPLLVTNPTNVRYLCGFESTNAALLVEPDRIRLFTDFRYAEAARQVDGVEFVETKRNVISALAELLEGRIGFEATHLTYAAWETLGQSGAIELVPERGIVERLRAVKDAKELEAMRTAAAITTKALEQLVNEPWIGRSELQLAWELERLLQQAGSSGVAFATIVASGPNSALPHAHPGDRVVQAGDLVIVDWGARVDGYCADCTRTFAAGGIDDDLRAVYEVCLDAQLTALPEPRAGANGRDVDAVARSRIDEAGYGKEFGHGLGHGVGIDIHEAPVLRPESEDTLEPGNVVTVEPGIYLAGRGGVRIEDLVVVTSGEPEVLTAFPKDLQTVS
jgi:Xaa-Pro aminopeptidase